MDGDEKKHVSLRGLLVGCAGKKSDSLRSSLRDSLRDSLRSILWSVMKVFPSSCNTEDWAMRECQGAYEKDEVRRVLKRPRKAV